jgi:5-methylthioribose kinase
LAAYLQKLKWIGHNETIISLTKPGAGNMNYVLRVVTDERTFIIKQSRAYVEKYPQIAAPENRVVTESFFYEKISSKKTVQKYMPRLIAIDVEHNVMVIEDLGIASDYSILYNLDHHLKKEELTALIYFLNKLHGSFKKATIDDELSNLEMRKLNHEHIFQYPFMEVNGFDLNSIQYGLEDLAMPFKTDVELKKQISILGALYISKGPYLLHGDYYPGSWLKTANGLKIIDPEFCYYGLREFDLGVLIAHMYLTQQPEKMLLLVRKTYLNYNELNEKILNGFIGVEIIRRLIGLAQLPLQMDLNTKKNLLAVAKKLILK